MDAVRRVVGRAVPLDRADVDTDQIVPSAYLKRIGRTGYADGCFAAWRASASFVLNDPRYAGATVLVAGANFGCGSSREHAAWALRDFGFRAVVAPSFADIFRANAVRSGLVPVALDAGAVERLMRAAAGDPSTEVDVDVERGRVRCAAAAIDAPLELDAFTRWRLAQGVDDIDLTLRHEDGIARYEAARASWLPHITGDSGSSSEGVKGSSPSATG